MAETKETVVELITMTDGRKVEFAGKRKLLKDSTITADGKVQIRLDFRNGETRTYTVPDNLMLKHAAHGAEQKLGDEIAGVADIDDAVLAIDELIDRLYNGEWNEKREANGMAGTSVLLKALCELYNKSPEDIKKFLSDKTQAMKIALRNSSKVKPIVERLEAEKAAKKGNVDTDALLAGLEG